MHFNYVIHFCTTRNSQPDSREVNATRVRCEGSQIGVTMFCGSISRETRCGILPLLTRRTQCVIGQSRAGAHLCDPTHRKSPEESKSQRQEGGGGGGGGGHSGCGVLLNGDRVSVQEGRNSQDDGEDGHTTM